MCVENKRRTKINKMRGAEGKEVDPLTLIHIMAKISAAGEVDTNLDVNLDFSVKQDIKGLKLSYIHGYRGFDCRDNLFYINDGTSVVYHAAAAGIVLDMATCNF